MTMRGKLRASQQSWLTCGVPVPHGSASLLMSCTRLIFCASIRARRALNWAGVLASPLNLLWNGQWLGIRRWTMAKTCGVIQRLKLAHMRGLLHKVVFAQHSRNRRAACRFASTLHLRLMAEWHPYKSPAVHDACYF